MADIRATYLALGDSYTIGELVPQQDSFPHQLKALLQAGGVVLTDLKIVATTGWTTDELQKALIQENIKTTFDVVTLLIGVNNQYRNYAQDVYAKEFSALLQSAIQFAGGDKSRVFVISIPDWGVTPFARNENKDPEKIALEIDAFNLINRQITEQAGVHYTDITPASKRAGTEPELLASDALHPSGKMYQEWAEALYPKVQAVLKQHSD